MIYFVIYVIISWIVLYFLSARNISLWLFRATIVTFLPIIGWLLPSIWVTKGLKLDESYFPSYMKAQFQDIKLELKEAKLSVNKAAELNVVPIEEALLINDYSTRRQVLIDVLKMDAFRYIDALKSAVINEDTETSHYAVTAISEEKRKLTILLQKLAVEYEHNRHDSESVSYTHLTLPTTILV